MRPLDVDPGWASFVVQARLDAPAPLRLVLPQEDGSAPEAPRERLWPAPPDQGLAVTLAGAGGLVSHRVDPFIAARALRTGPPTDPGFAPLASSRGPGASIRWEGEVLASAGGRYTMALRTDAQAQLAIDGQVVVSHCAAQFQSPPTTGPVDSGPRLAPRTDRLAVEHRRVGMALDATGRQGGSRAAGRSTPGGRRGGRRRLAGACLGDHLPLAGGARASRGL